MASVQLLRFAPVYQAYSQGETAWNVAYGDGETSTAGRRAVPGEGHGAA
jgi:hypothetical protein